MGPVLHRLLRCWRVAGGPGCKAGSTAWQRRASRSAQTSNIPFAAIAAGRNRFVAAEYFDWRFTVAMVLFGALLYLYN
jgi:uncharacterized membrane protein